MNFQNKFELHGVLTNYKTPHFPLQLTYHKKLSFKIHRFLLGKVGIFKPSCILGSTRPFPHPKLPTTSLHFIKHPLKKGLRQEHSKLHHRQNVPRIQIRAKQKGQPFVPPTLKSGDPWCRQPTSFLSGNKHFSKGTTIQAKAALL